MDKAGGCVGNAHHPNVGTTEPATCVPAPSIDGDFNDDLKVDAADWYIWKESNGQSGSELPADQNNDGVVNKADCEIWKGHFGEGTCLEEDADPNTCHLPAYYLGDYNRDQSVDAADYAYWRDSLGATGTGLPMDGNNDGTVDAADYTIWRDNYGSGRCYDPEP